MQIPEMSQYSRKVFVLCDLPPLCFLGKPSVWGSRPWSSPTPSPSSSSSSIISWLRGGVLFPYQPPRRPDPRLGWEDLWGSPWWLHLGGLMTASTAYPLFLQEPRERKLLFISSQLFPIWVSTLFCLSVSQLDLWFLTGSSLISWKKNTLLLISPEKISPITSDPAILEQI